MTTTEAPRPSRGRLAGVGWLLAAASVGWAFFLHHGLGPRPGPGSLRAWEPRGFLLEPLAELGLLEQEVAAIAVVLLPALALAVAVFLTTRHALPRLLAVSSAVAGLCFGFYGLVAPGVWNFFHWRASACLVLFSVVVGAALVAPLLATSLRRLGAPLRVALYLPIFLALVIFERNVTGTDPSLPFAVSPWPAVQIFGLETVATAVAFVLFGVAEGLWAFARLPETAGRSGRIGAAAVGIVVAIAFPAVCIGIGTQQGLLPFQMRAGILEFLTITSLLTLLAAAAPIWRDPERLLERARDFGLGALLLGAPLILGQTLTRLDYEHTRNVLAAGVIGGLDRYYEERSEYPDELSQLVESGNLEQIPKPRIGFAGLADQEFVYQNFGTNYVLEFSSPRWIQCAYNPPWVDEVFDEEEAETDEEAEALGEAWSCPSKPPELW